MRNGNRVAAIIPALNEENAIGRVVDAIPEWVDDVIVVDNGSTDNTPAIAAVHGARVIFEPHRGYGSACLTGIACLRDPEIVVFLDGDFGDYPEEADRLVDPIVEGKADLVVGSRVLGHRQTGALTPQAIFGNWLFCKLIDLLWHVRFTDLGPFRAIRFSTLQRLGMRDPGYGWTVEMQIKAARSGLRCLEVPVSYRKRIGNSKISGTVRGVLGAGIKILYTILASALDRKRFIVNSEETIIVLCRYPEPGKTKTRLTPMLGPQGASDCHKLLAEVTVEKARNACADHPMRTIEVHYTGGSKEQMSKWLGADLFYIQQADGDLGQRMHSSLVQAFGNGSQRAVIVGTDAPGLSVAIIDGAFSELKSRDLAIGPSEDGGYYLIGLNRPHEDLFQGVSWGTDSVMKETLGIAKSNDISYSLIAVLKDIDRPEDLLVSEGSPSSLAGSKHTLKEQISVIVPVLNEEKNIAKCLTKLKACEGVEIIVVDGGSTDRTVNIAGNQGAKVLMGPTGRAVQMNLGALVANGEFLVFLHGDTLLPDGWDCHVRHELQSPGTVAGAFELGIDSARPALRLIELLANCRSRWLGMPYGDQAIFLRSETFRALGGFQNQPVMEDFELMKRLRKNGTIRIARAAVRTSARRWEKIGIWKTTAINQLLIIAYSFGISTGILSRWYGRHKTTSSVVTSSPNQLTH